MIIQELQHKNEKMKDKFEIFCQRNFLLINFIINNYLETR